MRSCLDSRRSTCRRNCSNFGNARHFVTTTRLWVPQSPRALTGRLSATPQETPWRLPSARTRVTSRRCHGDERTPQRNVEGCASVGRSRPRSVGAVVAGRRVLAGFEHAPLVIAGNAFTQPVRLAPLDDVLHMYARIPATGATSLFCHRMGRILLGPRVHHQGNT